MRPETISQWKLFVLQDQLRLELISKGEEEDKLSQKIVQSPGKVRIEQEGLEQQVEEKKEALKMRQTRLGYVFVKYQDVVVI